MEWAHQTGASEFDQSRPAGIDISLWNDAHRTLDGRSSLIGNGRLRVREIERRASWLGRHLPV